MRRNIASPRPAAKSRACGLRGAAVALAAVVLPALLSLSAPARAGETVMYRYINAQGDAVYSYTLPPDQAGAGYQKIDVGTGQVIESVAPKLPPAQLAAKLQREKAVKACQDELTRIYQLYGSEADIDHARQQALGSLDTRIDQLQANLRRAKREQEQFRTQAADAERAGEPVAAALLRSINDGHARIDALNAEITQRRQEQTDTKARFAHDLARFRDGTCPATLATADTAQQ